MKLQKQLSRKVGNKEYAKWVVTIPPKEVQKLGWKEGQELGYDSHTGKLILKPTKK